MRKVDVAVHRKQARRRRDRGKERSSRAGPTRFKGVLSTTLSCSLFSTRGRELGGVGQTRHARVLISGVIILLVMERKEAILILLSEPR
jgi:hypothetical protein